MNGKWLFLLFLLFLLPLLAACSSEPAEILLSPLEEAAPVFEQDEAWDLRIVTRSGRAVPAVIETPQSTPEAERTIPTLDPSNGQSYILNTNTKRFHLPSCPSVEEMKPENREAFTGTRDELLERGYTPCGRCKP